MPKIIMYELQVFFVRFAIACAIFLFLFVVCLCNSKKFKNNA